MITIYIHNDKYRQNLFGASPFASPKNASFADRQLPTNNDAWIKTPANSNKIIIKQIYSKLNVMLSKIIRENIYKYYL
jgi:hypothetical protein